MLGRAGRLAEAFIAVNVAYVCPQGQAAVLDTAAKCIGHSSRSIGMPEYQGSRAALYLEQHTCALLARCMQKLFITA